MIGRQETVAQTPTTWGEAGITAEEWHRHWDAERMSLSAGGETGKALGNETIMVSPHR